MSRETLLYAGGFLKDRGHEPRGRGYVGRHRAVKTLEVLDQIPPAVAVAVLELVVELEDLGAEVRVVEGVDNGQCIHCQLVGAVANVRLYDGGFYDEMCRECAPAAVKAARTDAVVVEVLR